MLLKVTSVLHYPYRSKQGPNIMYNLLISFQTGQKFIHPRQGSRFQVWCGVLGSSERQAGYSLNALHTDNVGEYVSAGL